VKGPGTALLFLGLGLTGCSGLFQSNAKPEQIYYLRAPHASTAAAPAGTATTAPAPAMPVSLQVARPQAGPGLDTAHIILVEADHRMNFYTGSRWPAPLSELIESLAVQALRSSGEWASVEDSGSPFPSDYLLQLHVRRFEADYTEGAVPVVHVMLDCILGRRQGREVLATFSAAGSAAAAANRLTEVVAAFEQATGTALDALVQQSVQAVRPDVQRASRSEERPLPAVSR
jgi:cholesterol transport system auxiliary component